MSNKKPQYSIESEKAILSAIFDDNNALSKVKSELLPSDFYSVKHRLIYAEMLKLDFDGKDIDHFTIPASLEESGLLEDAGGFEYSGDLAVENVNSNNIKTFAETVKGRSASRKLTKMAIELLESSHSDDPEQTLSLFKESLSDLSSLTSKKEDRLFTKIVRNADDALNLDEPDYWIEDYFPKDSFSMIYGPSGQFKSFIAMDIACAIATGGQYHGNDVEKAPVLYMTGEGQRSINVRKKAWQVKNGKDANDLLVLGYAVDMTDSSGSSELMEAYTECEEAYGVSPKILVIDTLNRSFGSGDENSSQDMSKFVRSCDEFRAATGCDILVIHHSGKDVTKGARGSSVLKAALDTEFSVARIGDDIRGRNVTISCTKIKDGQEPPDLTFNMKSVLIGKKSKKGRDVDSLVPELIDKPEIGFVEEGEQVFIDIVNNLGNGATVGAVLKEFKQNMPTNIDQSQAVVIINAIIPNCGAYVSGGRYHLPG